MLELSKCGNIIYYQNPAHIKYSSKLKQIYIKYA